MYLRGYRPADVSALFALDTTCFDPPFRFSRGAMRRFAETKGAIVWLACEGGAEGEPESLLGFCIVHLRRERKVHLGYIVTLDVAPEHRRKGVARTLIRAVEKAAGEEGASAMWLHVFGGNAPAIRLYECLGYSFVKAAPHFYGKALAALIYGRPLARWLPGTAPEDADADARKRDAGSDESAS